MTEAPGPRLRAGMVGGGEGADIGKTHRAGMNLDGRYTLAAGVFGRDHTASSRMGADLGVPADRIYRDHEDMAAAESSRPDGIDVAVVVTPNDSHFDVTRAFLSRGISVVCEKPLTLHADDARELVRIAADNDAILAVPHCYSAYAMVREAAHRVRGGELGDIRFVSVEHASGWAARPLEQGEHRQARWRTDPDIGGSASVVADLGTHALHLLRFVTGQEPTAVSAQLDTLVPGRAVFDNATMRVALTGGAQASLWASMAATGNPHGLRIRVFGSRAALEWDHHDPTRLRIRDHDGVETVLNQGSPRLSIEAGRLTRAGLGHPEGFLEAFANFYADLADALTAHRDGLDTPVRELSFPTGRDGLIGVEFVAAVLDSHDRAGAPVATANLTGVPA
uniref:Gfo/Idh/MocA family protein n=1 Tax=Gordonia sp. B7-2 TaxID=3420932 RepID=UPI003D8F5F80